MRHPKNSGCDGNHFRRRDFLRVGSLTFLGAGLGQFLELSHALEAAESVRNAKAQACILLWLDGGASQIDTFDPKPNSSFKAISSNVPGIQVSELLPKVSKHMDKLSVIRSMHTLQNNHFQGTHYALTGHNPNRSMKFPGFPSIITKELGPRNNVPPNVMVPAMAKQKKRYQEVFKGHIISAEHDPLVITDVNAPETLGGAPAGDPEYQIPDLSIPKSVPRERIEARQSILDVVDRHYRSIAETADFGSMDIFRQQAWNMILSPDVRKAFDITGETAKTRENYGMHGFGQSVLMARRLVEAGSRFVTAAGFAGQSWDTHGNHDKSNRDVLCPNLDQSLSALLEDLDQRGMLESTIVLVMGEFGRTPDINPTAGRDHWPECWSVQLAGGGIEGGKIVGASDEKGAYVADRKVSMGDLYATIYKAMGIDWTKEYMHPIGRPVKIANGLDDETGTPVHELV